MTNNQIKILVVDDDDDARSVICLMFKDSRYEITEAVTGEEAITKYETVKPDLVTMDLVMPGMGGVAATKKILSLFPDAKIIIITALQLEEVSYLKNIGKLEIVTKPFGKKDILEAVAKIA